MPVEERLRHALAEQAGLVGAEVEGPLALVRGRRAKATGWKVGGAAAAVAAMLAATALLSSPGPQDPQPAGPPEPEDPPVASIPLATYVRDVTAAEALADGFPRDEVRHLFDGDRQVQVRMTFRVPPTSRPERNGWVVTFVDADGERRVRDGGHFVVTDDGELAITSLWSGCFGCAYRVDWTVEQGRLRLSPTPETSSEAMASLLTGGTWQRIRR